MIFDRLTLLGIYDTLQTVDDNDDRVSSILLHRISKYGTKTLPRFNSPKELRDYIDKNYPFVAKSENYCGCLTCNEGFFELLNFKVKDIEDTSMFINNLRREFESGKGSRLNGLSVKALKELFRQNVYMKGLFESYVCFPYIQDPELYTDPCEYIEIIKNIQYANLIELYMANARRADMPRVTKNPCG